MACAAPLASVPPARAEAILGAISAAEKTRTSLAADGVVTLRKSGVPVKGQLAVLADAAGRLRVDVSSEAGNLLFALASDGKEVTLIDLQQRRFVRSPAGPDDLGPLGLSGISTLALSQLFLARQPCAHPEVLSEAPELTCQNVKTAYKNGMLRHVDWRGIFTAELLGHTSTGLPRRLQIHTQEGDIVIQVADIDVNPKLSDAAFQLHAPPGLR